jgi:hypothetical protein
MKRIIAFTLAGIAIIIAHRTSQMTLEAAPPPPHLEEGLETATFGLG